MLDRQFKAIAFRGEGKDIEAHVVDCVLAEDCAALIQRAREEVVAAIWEAIKDQFPDEKRSAHTKAFKEVVYRAAGLREGEKP